ncbi:MAG: hypothetical protein KBG17_10660 [Paludibacteraceae bacterium]|nr:hypothetical protein [Paludibacteraceae bacterium]
MSGIHYLLYDNSSCTSGWEGVIANGKASAVSSAERVLRVSANLNEVKLVNAFTQSTET